MSLRAHVGNLYRRLTQQTPLIEIRVSRRALLNNLHIYQKAYPSLRFAPVLKSNAYGHGLVVVARLLDKEDIAFFMVDSLYEARVLRRAGVKSRIVVMGYVRPEHIAHSKLKAVDFAVVDIEQLRSLVPLLTRPTRLHLKLDTGMHRQGVLESDLLEALQLLRSSAHAQVVGVASHLADADNPSEVHTEEQLSAWRAMVRDVTTAFPSIEYRHLSATKGVRFAEAAGTNVVRIGMGLYGYNTSPAATLPLQPALSMRSIVSSIRSVPAGDWVGYNATYRAVLPRRIATVPVGYYEGVDRSLSNTGLLSVAGMPCPIVGRVSMNMCSIDVTDVPSAAVGDEVLVISDQRDDPNSVLAHARAAHTTPYVLLAHLPSHLLRVVGK